MRHSERDTGARTARSVLHPRPGRPTDQPTHGLAAGRRARPGSGHRRQIRRAAMLGTLALLLAGAATWYGFLESGGAHPHPTLKLGGAMALAGIGTALLVVARPINGSRNGSWSADRTYQQQAHSALVEVHPIVLGLAWASLSAALIHDAVIEQHLVEYWLYGWFFAAVATGQLAWALAAVLRPARRLLMVGAVGNALVAMAWVVTRTYGSLLGPEATDRAMVGFGDVASTLLEVAIVVGCLGVLAWPRIMEAGSSHRREVASMVLGVGVTLLTVLGLYSAVGGSPFVSHVG
jgi:hypothetical protein